MTTGKYNRFTERIKKIAKSKGRKRNCILLDSNRTYSNFLKVLAAIPVFVYGNLVDTKSDNGKDVISVHTADILYKQEIIKENKRIMDKKKIEKINVDDIRLEQLKFYKTGVFNSHFSNVKTDNNLHVNDANALSKRVKTLEKSIINLIKKDLIKIVNEMEILQSELYILSEVNGDTKTLKDCQYELDQVKDMICKVDKLKAKYDFLSDNYDFEYLLEVDNNDLVDKIIELKDIFGNHELRAISDDYKLLDVYKYLYLKLDKLHDKMILFEDAKEKNKIDLVSRDIDFEKLKCEACNIDLINRNYQQFVSDQEDLINRLNDKVGKLSSYEIINYRMKGFNEILSNSFKYFGLLLISPLKGTIPSIAIETIITGNLIKNLYNNLQFYENRKIVYETINYNSILSSAHGDLDSAYEMVDDTLDKIVRLKMEYNNKFHSYQGDYSEYMGVISKINNMENKILGNKIKIETMKKQLLLQQEKNRKALKLVHDLNKTSNDVSKQQ